MELFDNDQKKTIAETPEPQQVAARVTIATLEFISGTPNSDIAVEANKNLITLRGRAGGVALEIACNGPNSFKVTESIGVQQRVGQPRRSAYDAGVLTLEQLDRRVTAWLKK